jgi:hypothetical protein
MIHDSHPPPTSPQELWVVAHACNPSTWETEAEEWSVLGQSGLHREILPHKTGLEVWLKP